MIDLISFLTVSSSKQSDPSKSHLSILSSIFTQAGTQARGRATTEREGGNVGAHKDRDVRMMEGFIMPQGRGPYLFVQAASRAQIHDEVDVRIIFIRLDKLHNLVNVI